MSISATVPAPNWPYNNTSRGRLDRGVLPQRNDSVCGRFGLSHVFSMPRNYDIVSVPVRGFEEFGAPRFARPPHRSGPEPVPLHQHQSSIVATYTGTVALLPVSWLFAVASWLLVQS